MDVLLQQRIYNAVGAVFKAAGAVFFLVCVGIAIAGFFEGSPDAYQYYVPPHCAEAGLSPADDCVVLGETMRYEDSDYYRP